jgi:hypothetical protein
LEIVIPPRAGHFSTLPFGKLRTGYSFAACHGEHVEPRAEALRQLPLLALRCGGRAPRKISNARFRDPISKLRKDLNPAQKKGSTAPH